jgi:hypothetical protein
MGSISVAQSLMNEVTVVKIGDGSSNPPDRRLPQIGMGWGSGTGGIPSGAVPGSGSGFTGGTTSGSDPGCGSGSDAGPGSGLGIGAGNGVLRVRPRNCIPIGCSSQKDGCCRFPNSTQAPRYRTLVLHRLHEEETGSTLSSKFSYHMGLMFSCSFGQYIRSLAPFHRDLATATVMA